MRRRSLGSWGPAEWRSWGVSSWDGVRSLDEALLPAVSLGWVHGGAPGNTGGRRSGEGKEISPQTPHFHSTSSLGRRSVLIHNISPYFLKKRLGILFTFARVPGVSWNSNGAEREERVIATHRKVSGGRKSEVGVLVFDRVLTVWRTCKKRGLRFQDVVLEKLGAPQPGPGPPSAVPGS